MKVSSQGIDFIRAFEGFSACPYRCPAGYWTIGYGHVIAGNAHPSITDEEALSLLRVDMQRVESAIRQFINVPLSQNQFDALASFTFNLGTGALQRSTLRRVINRGEHSEAANQFLRWVWGGGRKLPGLVRRRAAEAALYRHS